MEKDPSQPHRLTTLSEITNKLFEQGFKEEFLISETGLQSIKTKEIFQPQDVKIIKHYRFEGTTDPADECIVFAIATNTGLKGSIVSGYGPQSDVTLDNFMKIVEELPNSNSPAGSPIAN